jgi:hypothetical protein
MLLGLTHSSPRTSPTESGRVSVRVSRSWGHPFSWISQNEVTGHVYMFRVFVSKAAAERPAVVFFEDNHLGPSIF